MMKLARSGYPIHPKHGGAMLDLCVHCFDMIMHLTAGKPIRVSSTVRTFGKHPLPDYSSMTQIVFSNGVIAQHWASVEVVPPSLPDSRFGFTIVGDNGILDIDGYGKLMLGTRDKWQTLWTMPPIDYVNNPFDQVRLQSYSEAVQAFIDDVLDHKPPTVPGEAGRAAVEIVEAAKRSSETGIAVGIPL
jgi:predicted dehydrogenase